MGRLRKKGQCGAATNYLSRKQALKKLQLSLKDFRRLCILKGIYPVEPKHKKIVNAGDSSNKTYYFLKDIQFLAHEPIIQKFRDFKVFIRRLKRAIGKSDGEACSRIRNNEPIYKLDTIVKERYPTFIDALRDIDDALSMCHLFATFPKSVALKPELIDLCRRVSVEFMHYVIESHSLRKVFISIKGFYYQAEIMGQTITWVVPHYFSFHRPVDVDFKIMVTFTEFYVTMLGFINYKLFNSANLFYPPKLQAEGVKDADLLGGEDPAMEHVAALNAKLKAVISDTIEEPQMDEFPSDESDLQNTKEQMQVFQELFKNLKFFLNREVPRESLVFIIRAFGGEVSWHRTVCIGATYDEDDETISHQIVDRPMGEKQYLSRYYIQPQWVYDSINARRLLPVEDYFPGVALPPHLSPFVEEEEGEYIPPEKKALMEGKSLRIEESGEDSEDEGLESDLQEEEDNEEEEVADESDGSEDSPKKRKQTEEPAKSGKKARMEVKSGQVQLEDKEKLAQRQAAEEKRLAVMMIPKKRKKLYEKIVYGQKRKTREASKLKEKREQYIAQEKASKKSLKT